MKLTRNLVAILALSSFAFAFAEGQGTGAKHHQTAASSMEMKDCGQCANCSMGTEKAPTKGAEKAPSNVLPASLLYSI